MPIDHAELQRKHDRFGGAMLIWSGVGVTAVGLGMQLWLQRTGWRSSGSSFVIILGVLVTAAGVKQLVKNLRTPRKVVITEARVLRPGADDIGT